MYLYRSKLYNCFLIPVQLADSFVAYSRHLNIGVLKNMCIFKCSIFLAVLELSGLGSLSCFLEIVLLTFSDEGNKRVFIMHNSIRFFDTQ